LTSLLIKPKFSSLYKEILDDNQKWAGSNDFFVFKIIFDYLDFDTARFSKIFFYKDIDFSLKSNYSQVHF